MSENTVESSDVGSLFGENELERALMEGLNEYFAQNSMEGVGFTNSVEHNSSHCGSVTTGTVETGDSTRQDEAHIGSFSAAQVTHSGAHENGIAQVIPDSVPQQQQVVQIDPTLLAQQNYLTTLQQDTASTGIGLAQQGELYQIQGVAIDQVPQQDQLQPQALATQQSVQQSAQQPVQQSAGNYSEIHVRIQDYRNFLLQTRWQVGLQRMRETRTFLMEDAKVHINQYLQEQTKLLREEMANEDRHYQNLIQHQLRLQAQQVSIADLLHQSPPITLYPSPPSVEDQYLSVAQHQIPNFAGMQGSQTSMQTQQGTVPSTPIRQQSANQGFQMPVTYNIMQSQQAQPPVTPPTQQTQDFQMPTTQTPTRPRQALASTSPEHQLTPSQHQEMLAAQKTRQYQAIPELRYTWCKQDFARGGRK